MENCEICGKGNNDKTTIVISPMQSLKVCSECLNLYANHEYGKLTERLKKNYGEKNGEKKK